MRLWRSLKVVQGRRKVFLFKRVNLWEASTAVSTGNDKEIGKAARMQPLEDTWFERVSWVRYSPPSARSSCPEDPKVGTRWGKPHVCLVSFPPNFHRINQTITHIPSYLVWEKGTKGPTRGVPGTAERKVRQVRVCMADSAHTSLFTFLATEGGEAASFSCGLSPSRSSGSQVARRGSMQAIGVARMGVHF